MIDRLINLSFYRFYDVAPGEGAASEAALRELKARVLDVCTGLDLKGTVLLAREGVNVMLSGSRESIDAFREYATREMGIDPALYKESLVDKDSFNRMLVKIKKEIIPVGDPELRPHERTAPRLTPAELKQWFDEGRPMILLDTRNEYEVEVGTFKGAETLKLENSRQFTERAAERFRAELSAGSQPDRPVVTFCTGGIRCEKASALLLKLGLKDVYQLDGGILRYFERNGAEHYDGSCFVFDWRMAVDGKLDAVPRSKDPSESFGRHQLEEL